MIYEYIVVTSGKARMTTPGGLVLAFFEELPYGAASRDIALNRLEHNKKAESRNKPGKYALLDLTDQPDDNSNFQLKPFPNAEAEIAKWLQAHTEQHAGIEHDLAHIAEAASRELHTLAGVVETMAAGTGHHGAAIAAQRSALHLHQRTERLLSVRKITECLLPLVPHQSTREQLELLTRGRAQPMAEYLERKAKAVVDALIAAHIPPVKKTWEAEQSTTYGARLHLEHGKLLKAWCARIEGTGFADSSKLWDTAVQWTDSYLDALAGA